MCQYVFCYNHQKIYMFLCLIIRLKEFFLKFFHFFLTALINVVLLQCTNILIHQYN